MRLKGKGSREWRGEGRVGEGRDSRVEGSAQGSGLKHQHRKINK